METKQKLVTLRNVVEAIIEAAETGYYEAEDLGLGSINYMEIRDWAGIPHNIDGQTIRNHVENERINRMIEDVCYLVQQQLF